MNDTFCEQNAAQQAPKGGILSNSSNSNAAYVHLSQIVQRWEEAFNSPLISQNAFTKFFDFDKAIVNQIIQNPECVAIRIFPGIDENGKITAALVGVAEDSSELIAVQNVSDMQICCCPSNGSSALFGH